MRWIPLTTLLWVAACGREPVGLGDPDGPGPTGSTADDPTTPAADLPDVTWHADIAPLFAENCVGCHQPGGIMEAIDLGSYEVAQAWAAMIGLRVETRRMPPFPLDQTDDCPQPWGFHDDRRLTDAEIALVTAWIDQGAHEGDPADAVSVEPPPEPALDRVDQVLGLPALQALPSSEEITDVTRCFVLSPGGDETRWLEGAMVVPGNELVVHHVAITVADREGAREADLADGVADFTYPCDDPGSVGDIIAGWAPGVGPSFAPEGSAFRVGADEVLTMRVHYHLVPEPQVDDTEVLLQWATEAPARRAVILRNRTPLTEEDGLLPGDNDRNGVPEFYIPAGAKAHTESMVWTAPEGGVEDHRVYGVLGHMHKIGVSIEAYVQHADGSRGECLMGIPRWDFDWQLLYTLRDNPLPVLGTDDQLIITCTYDNTLDNPGVVEALDEIGEDEPQDVVYGLSSADEMCSMALVITTPNVP